MKQLLITTMVAIVAMVTLLALSSADAKEHLFILSGQSNMVMLNPKISFTPTLNAEFKEENITVVKDAEGGQPIRRWYKKWKPAPGEDAEAIGELYDRLMKKVRAATKGKTYKTVTFIWLQGERDAKEGNGERYAVSLRGLIDQLAEDLQRKHVNFVVGRLGVHDIDGRLYPHWNMVRKAQVEVAEAYLRGAWVNTDDLGDDIHYTPEGYKILGRRLAEKSIALIHKHGRDRPGAPKELSVD